MPNYEFVKKLHDSAALFSAHKTFHQVQELAALLQGEGTKTSWREFRAAAKPIVNDYNETWLRTEYDTAIRVARNADAYNRYLQSADVYPNLEYMPSRAANPRDSHRKLWGIIRPINDSFWNTHLPPSDWNCQCWVQPSDTEPTALPEILPKVAAGLDNNPAKTGELFSRDHPYFKKVGKEDEAKIKEDLKTLYDV